MVTILGLQFTVAANVFIKDPFADQARPPKKVLDFVWHRKPPYTTVNSSLSHNDDKTPLIICTLHIYDTKVNSTKEEAKTLHQKLLYSYILSPQRTTASSSSLPLLLQMGNELNSDIVLGLVILIITLLALSRFQQVELVLERISEAVGTLIRTVILLQQLEQMAHDGFQQVVSILELIDVVGSLVNQLLRLVRACREIWSIWTTGQPSANANDGQNEESNI